MMSKWRGLRGLVVPAQALGHVAAEAEAVARPGRAARDAPEVVLHARRHDGRPREVDLEKHGERG